MQDMPLQELVALILTGVEEDPPWQTFVRRLRRELRSRYAGVVLRHSSTPQWNGFSSSDAAWDLTRWRLERLPDFFGDSHLFPALDLTPGQVHELDRLLDREDWRSSEVYRQVMHPVGMDHVLCLCLGTAGGQRGHVYLGRGEAEGPYVPDELALCQSLIPWLQQALQLHQRLAWKSAELDAAEEALKVLGIGSMLLDQNGQVLSADAIAQAILAKGSVLSISEGRLQLLQPKATALFQAHARELMDSDDRGAKALRLSRPGQADLTLLLRRAPQRDHGHAIRPSLLLHLSDPDLTPRQPAGSMLSELFNLTPREASVAALMATGLPPAEVAQRLTLTPGTVRIYLKRIYAKTGVNRQAELVRLISGSLAMLDRPGAR